MTRLSPLNFRGLVDMRRSYGPAGDAKRGPVFATEGREDARKQQASRVWSVTRYVCPTCDEEHEYRDDAVDCCLNGIAAEDQDPIAAPPGRCPVCIQQWGDAYSAVDCCLWKDIDKPERERIAAAVEAGSTWESQLNIDAALFGGRS